MFEIKKSESSTMESTEYGSVVKKLSEKLRNSLILALVVLWVSTLTVPVHRTSWILWAIASLIVFLVYIFAYRRKKLRFPKLRWVLPFLGVGLLWLMYFLTGISFSKWWFIILAIILLLWTIPLFVTLIAALIRRGKEQGKFDKAVRAIASFGDSISWFLTIVTLFFGVIMGWIRLWNSGIKYWWMEPLLLWGVLIFLVVSFSQFPVSDH